MAQRAAMQSEIAAATVAAAPGGTQRQQRLFNVYVRTPSNVVGMRAAPEEASIAEADKLSPAAALQKFVDWALKQQRQHAGQEADPSRLVLVSHYGFCYAFSILVQHAERCGVQLPPVRLADSCLWTKATYGGNKEAPLEDLADLLLYDRQWDHFNDVVRTQQHYALADVLATSQVVPMLYLRKCRAREQRGRPLAAAAGASSADDDGWKRELLALSTPLREFVGRLGLAPDAVVDE